MTEVEETNTKVVTAVNHVQRQNVRLKQALEQ